jgi:hypothetical protein
MVRCGRFLSMLVRVCPRDFQEISRDDVVLEGQRVSRSANDAIQRRIAFGPSTAEQREWRYIIQERRLPLTNPTYCTTAPGIGCDGAAGICVSTLPISALAPARS